MGSIQPTPPGGPSTFNGVLYQILWSLLRAMQIHFSVVELDNHKYPTRAVLTLEPRAGGDVLESIASTRRVIQLKSRSTGRNWALGEVVADVLPDLYRSVDLAIGGTEFDFITDGEIGQWLPAYRFFQALRERQQMENVAESLDGRKKVRFSRKWPLKTEREFFQDLVDRIRESGACDPEETLEQTQQKMWHLLARFRFIGRQRQDAIKEEINALLLPLVDYGASVEEKRAALLQDLLESAAKGTAIVQTDELLKKYKLDAVPLTDWGSLLARSQRELERALKTRRYDRDVNVREEMIATVARTWPAASPFLAVNGESGVGKSWLLYGLAVSTSREHIVVLLDSTGSALQDMKCAAEIFSQRMADQESSPSLFTVASRWRKVVRRGPRQWLTILLDGVQTIDEARGLARECIEDWGVRLAISGPQDVIDTFVEIAGSRARLETVLEFSSAERDTFLERRLGDDWTHVPHDVRDTLRRPLLAQLYCELAGPDGWRPENEYALYDGYWKRIHYGERARFVFDAPRLAKLSVRTLKDEPYPWPIVAIEQAGLDEAGISRLVQCGWLRPTRDNEYEIPHDRLLNFAVAQGLLNQLIAKEITTENLGSCLRDILTSNRQYSGRRLQYVPMDVLYLVLEQGDPAKCAHLVDLITSDESLSYEHLESFYAELLPTLGDKIVPVLLDRFEAESARQRMPTPNPLIQGLSKCAPSQDVADRAMRLLEGGSGHQKRAAAQLLSACPHSVALDALWRLHNEMQLAPENYAENKQLAWLLYRESFAALLACVRLDHDWLAAAIGRSSSDDRISDLAYLVAKLKDRELWLRCKADLIAKVPAHKRRSLATCITEFRDLDERSLLTEVSGDTTDWAAPAAIRALARVDPSAAVDRLARLPVTDLVGARGWFLPLLLELCREETRARLRERILGERDPWRPASVYQGFENDLDQQTFETLLNALEERVRNRCEHPPPHNRSILFRPLTMLSEGSSLPLLDSLRKRRDTGLERNLTALLVQIGARPGIGNDNLERDPALSLLKKIDGVGFGRVINNYLNGGSRYGRLDAIGEAVKAPDQETRRLLAERTLSGELWDDYPLEQTKAAEVLAAIGETTTVVNAVVELGLHIDERLNDYVTAPRPFDDEAMSRAFSALDAKLDGTRVGAVIALGIGRRTDRLPQILELWSMADVSSAMSLACTVAAGWLEPQGNREVIHLLRRQLGVDDHRRYAKIALFAIGSDEALKALLEDARHRHDLQIAVTLTNFASARSEAAELVHTLLIRGIDDGRPDALHAALSSNRDVLRSLMQSDVIRSRTRDVAHGEKYQGWDSRLRPAAIRALATVNRKDALLAAKSALRDTSHHAQELYPILLIELDPPAALDALVESGLEATATWTLQSIARSLANIDVDDTLNVLFESPDPRQRRLGCVISSGRSRCDEGLRARLAAVLNDQDSDVADAALDALRALRRMSEVAALVQAYREEKDDRRRWILLDAMITLGDAGDDGSGTPAWAKQVADTSTEYACVYLAERLRKKRDTERRNAEEADRQAQKG